jgi:hypothetical protein
VATRFVTGGREGPARAPSVAVLLVYLTLLASAAAQEAAPTPYLVVRDADGAELARFALDEDPRWHLAWRHSVTANLVRDYYEVRDGTMVLTQTHTPAYDAGLGHIPGRGRAESDGRGGYWIRDIDEPVPGDAYWLRVGSEQVGHTLVHGARRVNLSALAAGQRVRIAVETL